MMALSKHSTHAGAPKAALLSLFVGMAWGCGSGSEPPAASLPPVGVGGGGGSEPQPVPPRPAGAGGVTPPAAIGGNGGNGEVVVLPNPPATAGCDTTRANAAGYCWQSVAIGGGGFVSAVVMSERVPNLIYARTDVGGAYRWDEAGARWLPLSDWVSENEVGLLGVESLAIDPSEPQRLYLLAGIDYFNGGKTAVLSSDDYGATFAVHEVTTQFTAHGNGLGRQNGERLAVDPNAGELLFVGTREDGLFRSSDRGATWSPVPSLGVTSTSNGNGIAFVLFDPAGGTLDGATRRLIVGVSRAGEPNLFESNDAGESFVPIAGQPTTFLPQRAALASDGSLYVTYANGAGPAGTPDQPMDRGQIWKLELASSSWTDITPLAGNANRAFGGISVDSANPERVLATTINTYREQPWGFGDRIFLSLDGGASWTDLIGAERMTMANNGMPWIEDHAIHWAGSIQIDPFDPERAFVTSGNGIFMTENLSAADSTWTFAVQGLEEMVPLDAASVRGAPLTSVIGDYDGFVHDDPRVSPARGRFDPAMGTTQGLAIAALAPSRVARVGAELYVSDDGAQSWTLAERPSQETGGRLAYSVDGATLLWSVEDTTYRSSDQGRSWAGVNGLAFETMPEADGLNPNMFYAYDPGDGALFASTDAGASFTARGRLSRGGARRIRAVPGVEGELWLALNGGGLTRSRDAGGTFEPIAAVQSCRAIGFGAPRSSGGFPALYIWGAAAGGPRGLYRSDDAGQSFVRINDDAHEYGGPGNGELVIGDANVYGRVYMSSAGRGLIMGESVPALP